MKLKKKIHSFGASFPLLEHDPFGVEIPWQELLVPEKSGGEHSGGELWRAGAAASPRTHLNPAAHTGATFKVGATMGSL